MFHYIFFSYFMAKYKLTYFYSNEFKAIELPSENESTEREGCSMSTRETSKQNDETLKMSNSKRRSA